MNTLTENMKIVVGAGAAVGAYILWNQLTKEEPMPTVPSIPGLPFIGNIFQIDRTKPHLTLEDFAKEYGNIFQINFLGRKILVVSDKDALYEILVKKGKDFNGRLVTYVSKVASDGHADVASSPASVPWWHDMKKATQAHLKGYGSGLTRLELITLETIEDTLNKLEKAAANEKAVSVIEELETALAIITYNILFDSKLERTEDRDIVLKVGRLLMEIAKPGGASTIWLAKFPWIRHFGNKSFDIIQQTLTLRRDLFKIWKADALEELKREKEPTSNFINRILKLKEDKLHDLIGERHILHGTWILFLAGTLTTSGTLSSLFHILADNPEIQRNLHEEVDSVAPNRNVQINDRGEMPYHRAVLYETLRMVPITPLLVPHVTSCDTSVLNHKVAEGTMVWPDVWTMQHDEKVFEEPYKFKPERFLDDRGFLVPADHPNRVHLLTFGAGPRVCAGETFAMTRMFLILAQMMKRFKILPPDVPQEPFNPRKMVNGMTLMAPDFKVKLINRK